MEIPLNPKAEKLALFRFGLVASLVIEALPRGELTRRAEEIAARQYDFPDRAAAPSVSVRCWNGPNAIAQAGSKRSPPSRVRTAAGRAPLLRN
jgi:hypothetical protein